MLQVNITLNIYSIIVCMVLFSYLCTVKGRQDKPRRYLAHMCIFNVGMMLGDCLCLAFEGFARPWYPTVLTIGSVLFYFCSGPLMLSFVGYILETLETRTRVDRMFWHLPLVLCAFQMLFSVLSIWNGMYFTLTPESTYQRGSWFLVSQLIPFIIFSLSGAMMIAYRRSLVRRDTLFLLSHILLPFVAEVIQILNYGISLLNASITIALLLVFIYIQSARELRMEHQEKELAEARIDIMLSQIQPHFLYNSLTAIRRLCDSNPIQAKATIRDFSQFLRGNMNALTSKAPIPFAQERIHTEAYLQLELQRAQDRLRVVYDITVQDFTIPPLTVQSLVENAVRHGVLRREEGGTVTISTAETDKSYLVVVRDDGVGFQSEVQEPKERVKIGLNNVRKRLADICSGTLHLESVPEQGTVATITIPKEGQR